MKRAGMMPILVMPMAHRRVNDRPTRRIYGRPNRHPAICVALLARYVPPGNVRVLDAGVGTGIVGELLAIVGYAAIDGIDISQGMLDKAAEKGLYADLRVADMTQPLDLIHLQRGVHHGSCWKRGSWSIAGGL